MHPNLQTDQELDPETGLYFYNARYYDPLIGRFISPDTIVQDYSDPQTLNRYSYCRNNPLIYVDPSGSIFGIDDLTIGALIWGAVKGAAIGAAVGGTVAAVTGEDIGQGMLTGAISGAFFGGVGAYVNAAGATAAGIQSVTKVGLHTAAGAASGGINSSITGGDVGIGMLAGGISGGLGMAVGKSGTLTWGDYPAEMAKRSLVGGLSGGVAYEMSGGRFGDGFASGAKTAAIGNSANCFGLLLFAGAVVIVEKVGILMFTGAKLGLLTSGFDQANGGNTKANQSFRKIGPILTRTSLKSGTKSMSGMAKSMITGGATDKAFKALNVTSRVVQMTNDRAQTFYKAGNVENHVRDSKALVHDIVQ